MVVAEAGPMGALRQQHHSHMLDGSLGVIASCQPRHISHGRLMSGLPCHVLFVDAQFG